jgi:hypothetical protein
LQPSGWATVAERLHPPSDAASGHAAPIPVGNAAAVAFFNAGLSPRRHQSETHSF